MELKNGYFSSAATGWLKQIAPNLLSIQCPRRFWEMDPEIWHTCPMNPCQPVTVFFPARYVFWGGVFGSYEIQKFWRKKTTHSSTAWQGRIEHVCKQSGYISKKRRGHFGLCAEMCNLRGCLVNSNFELVFVSRIPQIRLKKSVTEIL